MIEIAVALPLNDAKLTKRCERYLLILKIPFKMSSSSQEQQNNFEIFNRA